MPKRGIHTETTVGTAGTAGETAVWTFNTDERWDGTSCLIVALHGHGTVDADGPLQYNQNTGAGSAAMALARTGRYVVCSIQAAGATSWSKPSCLTAITSAVTVAHTRGARAGKYGLLGYSMGGLEVVNKIKRDSANIAAAWTWAPALDLDYCYSTAGHPILANNAAWTTEIDAAFGSYAATAGYRVWDEPATYRSLGVKWQIAHATDDATIPYSVSSDFVTAVNDPNVSLHAAITGNHTGLFANVGDQEIVRHFDTGNW